jgi:hypothetical protein
MTVGYIYNPYQLLIIIGLAQNGTQFNKLIVPNRLYKLTQNLIGPHNIQVIPLNDAYVSDGKIKKIISNIKNIFLIKHLKCSNLYISNDQSIVFLIACMIFRTCKVILIDEGALEQLILRERHNPTNFPKLWKKMIFRAHGRAQHPQISKLIVFDEARCVWDEFKKSKIIESGSLYLTSALSHLTSRYNIKDLPDAILIATSPLTENRNAKYDWQELKIIEKLIANNQDKSFILKLHYREADDKYDEIISKYPNVSKMVGILNQLPLQLMFSCIFKVVGFHSSVITQFGSQSPGCAMSLSHLVDSTHSRNFVLTSPKGVKFIDDFKT